MQQFRTYLLLLVALRSLLGVFAAEPPATFGLTNIWRVEVRTTPQGWQTLTSSRTFTHADINIDGVSYTNVAVRQKGQGTSGGAGMDRPPLRLVFKGQSVSGVKKLRSAESISWSSSGTRALTFG